MPLCQNLKNRCQRIKTLRDGLVLACEEARNLDHQKLAIAWKAKESLEREREELLNILVPKKISANWENPETKEKKEISIDFEQETKLFQEFYRKHLQIELDTKEIRSILRRRKYEIQKEMETLGYDRILIIPDNLPDAENLNKELIETMDEGPGKGQVAATWQSDNFKGGGSFAGLKNTEKPGHRIVLVHSDQNVHKNQNANPYLKETLNKNIPMLILNISPKEWDLMKDKEKEKKAQEAFQKINQGADIDFETEINGKKTEIKAEGLSLREYELFQRMYFEKDKKHLDEEGWTWLLKSYSVVPNNPRVVLADWDPGDRQLDVHAYDPSYSYDYLCLRLSRSFS